MLISLTGYAFQYVYIQQNIKMFISQSIYISKHHVCCINIHQNVIYNDVLIQCIQFLFVNYTLIKLKKMQILPQVNIIVKFIVQTCSKSLHFSCKQKGSSNFIKQEIIFKLQWQLDFLPKYWSIPQWTGEEQFFCSLNCLLS